MVILDQRERVEPRPGEDHDFELWKLNADRDERLWKHYADAEEKMAHSLDKTVLTLSAGALALSVTFVHDIAPQPTHTGLLVAAWSCFILSLVLVAVSMLTSQDGLRRVRDSIGREPPSRQPRRRFMTVKWSLFRNFQFKCRIAIPYLRTSMSALATLLLNYLAVAALVTGLMFLICFSHWNLQKEIPMSTNKPGIPQGPGSGQRGLVPPTPPPRPQTPGKVDGGVVPPRPPQTPPPPQKK